MKKLLLFAIAFMLFSCNSGDDETKTNQETEPKLILKTENISFQNASAMPKAMWLSTSTVDAYSNSILVSDGVDLYTIGSSGSWSYAYSAFSNTHRFSWGNLVTDGNSVVFFNGSGNGGINSKAFFAGINGGSTASTNIPTVYNVRSAGSTKGQGNKYYIAGGSDGLGNLQKSVYEINFNFNTKTIQNIDKITELPEAKETQIEFLNNKLYVIGGYNGTASKRIDVFDLSTNKWTFLGNMPYGFSSHSTCVQGSKIWIVGSYNLTDQQLAYYNTATNEFVTVNSNIIARRHANAEIIGNKLYVIGGATTSSSLSALTSVQVANLQ